MKDFPAFECDLCNEAYRHLRAAPQGLSEYALIQQLKASATAVLPDLPLSDSLGLFRTHFLLFNALYRLRDQLWSAGLANLSISPLLIQLQPYAAGSQLLAEHDALRAYYLDPAHLSSTDADEVDRLLRDFWLRLHTGPQEVQAALKLFGLPSDSAGLDLKTIKHRYRQLVSEHHPDRGGETAQLQSINKAMEILHRHFAVA